MSRLWLLPQYLVSGQPVTKQGYERMSACRYAYIRQQMLSFLPKPLIELILTYYGPIVWVRCHWCKVPSTPHILDSSTYVQYSFVNQSNQFRTQKHFNEEWICGVCQKHRLAYRWA